MTTNSNDGERSNKQLGYGLIALLVVNVLVSFMPRHTHEGAYVHLAVGVISASIFFWLFRFDWRTHAWGVAAYLLFKIQEIFPVFNVPSELRLIVVALAIICVAVQFSHWQKIRK